MNKDPLLFTIAHISDLHFSKISFGISQLFSKRCIGNLNLIFNRARVYKNERPFSLLNAFKDQGVSHVFISGDLSTTSSKPEFEMAQKFIKELQKQSIQVFTIPGNHDAYTNYSYRKKLFYKYFTDTENSSLNFNLKTDGVSASSLGDQFWLVRVDSTYPSAFYRSTGLYTQKHDAHLRSLLNKIPKDNFIILMNHFPLFHHEHPSRIMYGAELLRKTLSLYPNIKLYLHGHTHRQCIADLRGSNLPIVMDSGSVSHVKKGSYNRIEIYKNSCVIDTCTPNEHSLWNSEKTVSYTW